MGSFLKTASKQVADVRNFLREAAGGNSIKYGAEKGARHFIYIPYVSQTVIDETTGMEAVSKQIIAISMPVHEWTTADGKFKAVACLKGTVINGEDGTVINDGSCPFCDRSADGWEIYNYRKDLEEQTCQLTGEARKQHLEKTFGTFRDERKAKEARNYIYLLVVKFRTNESGQPTIGTDGLPEYDLKVMKLSASRVEKIQQQIMNSGAELPGSELIFEYPNTDDRRLLVGQSTTTPVFPTNMFTVKYQGLVDKINKDVAKFDWDGTEKAFAELAGMSVAEAKKITDNQFEQWDLYKRELVTNPSAKYLEYVVQVPTAKPSLTGATAEAPVLPGVGAPVIPNIPNIPNVAPVDGVAMPQVGTPDPNSVFAGNGMVAPSITV